MASRAAATPAASQRLTMASEMTPATVRSSLVLTTTLLTGSGEVLTTSAQPGLDQVRQQAVMPRWPR